MPIRTAASSVVIAFDSALNHTLTDGQIASASISQSLISTSLTSGVSVRQANRAWEDLDVTISSGATLDIDLYDFAAQDLGAGLGRDGLGLLITLEEIVCLIIKQTTGPGRLEIMPTSPANSVDWIPAAYATVANGGALKRNGVHVWYQDDELAYDVEDGSNHMLRLGANGGNVAFDIYVLGRHDDNESSSSSVSTSSRSSSSSGSSSSSSSNAFSSSSST